MINPIQKNIGLIGFPNISSGRGINLGNCGCGFCQSCLNYTNSNQATTSLSLTTNSNNSQNNIKSLPNLLPVEQIKNYPIIQQKVIPQLLALFDGKFKNLSEITLNNLPPALPTSQKQIRILSSDDPLLDEMIPNIKELREIEKASSGQYKLITFENIANHDVIAILDKVGTNSIEQAIQIAQNSPLYDQRSNKLYEHNGVSREITGVKIHELAHWLTLKEVKASYENKGDIELSGYRQGISFVLTHNQNGSTLVTGLRSFGQTTYLHRKIFVRHDNLINQFNNLETNYQQVIQNGYKVYDAQTQSWRPLNNQELNNLVNMASYLVNRAQDLIQEEETLEIAAYAPEILAGTIFEEHGNPSRADREKYAIAKQLQTETINLLRESQILLNKIESLQNQVASPLTR